LVQPAFALLKFLQEVLCNDERNIRVILPIYRKPGISPSWYTKTKIYLEQCANKVPRLHYPFRNFYFRGACKLLADIFSACLFQCNNGIRTRFLGCERLFHAMLQNWKISNGVKNA
jgi:hypothetical protein